MQLESKLESKVEELYHNFLSIPNEILESFNMQFGEKHVDMQGFLNLKDFKESFKYLRLDSYMSKEALGISADEFYDIDYINIYKLKDIDEGLYNKAIDALSYDAVIQNIGVKYFNDLFILVYMPTVRVTNEHDRFVDITDLFIKVSTNFFGTLRGTFKLNRSSYTCNQMRSTYMHSHINGIPIGEFSKFLSPCLGSGPINDTICTLNRDYDSDIWRLFCLEIYKYVHVESLGGGPYRYLENIGNNNNGKITSLSNINHCPCNSVMNFDRIKNFIAYFINKKILKFNYINGSYSIGYSFTDSLVIMSNIFIEWYNEEFRKGSITTDLANLLYHGVVKKSYVIDGGVYYKESIEDLNRYSQYIGSPVCTFKGNEIKLSITDLKDGSDDNIVITMNLDLCSYIYSTILKLINYKYGREEDTNTECNSVNKETKYI